MTGYEVGIEEIRAASRAAASAAAQRRDIDTAAVPQEARTALPGSRSADLLAQVATRWCQAVDHWSGAMGGHAEALTHTADAYAANEEAATRDFRLIGGTTTGRARAF